MGGIWFVLCRGCYGIGYIINSLGGEMRKELIKLLEKDKELFSLTVFIGSFGLIGIIGLILWVVQNVRV